MPEETESHWTRKEFLRGALALAAGGSSALAAALIARLRPPQTFRKLLPENNPFVRPAKYWNPVCAGVQCTLCPFECFLPEGARGLCRIRMNAGGKLVTLAYGHPVAVHVDPMEKKPVFHMLPGTLVYSLAAVGCNLRCSFCQNWEISQSYPEQADVEVPIPRELLILPGPGGARLELRQEMAKRLDPTEIVGAALATRCRSVAYTYSEPAVFFEYVLDAARLVKAKGLRNVLISAGYINPEPLAELAPYFDVIKVDLKGFNEAFYRRVVGGELRFVMRTITELKKHGVFTELVNLVVPGQNDDPREAARMCSWIMKELGPDVPLFFSRFMPQYRMQNLPPTPVETLERMRNTAMEAGLRYVYLGNVPGHPGENTYCPTCHRVLIRRIGLSVLEDRVSPRGVCPWDGTRIPGIWT